MSGINTGIQTISQRVYLNNEDNYRTNLFYPMIDAVLIGCPTPFIIDSCSPVQITKFQVYPLVDAHLYISLPYLCA